jgi:hypothetical protein
MPADPTPAQADASRSRAAAPSPQEPGRERPGGHANGARSTGPASDAGKARSALNGVRHGLCGRTFFLLPDEDPAEFRRHEAMWLAA